MTSSSLASYACSPNHSSGRAITEPPATERDCYQRDRDRILHSTAFRRLKEKSQVLLAGVGDHYRTRLTHSLEVSQVARTLARALHVNEDLCEAIALAHDLGHTPFAHKGEDVLALLMAPFGGFAHNDQTVRILTHLERRYPGFNGLNLSYETLEGLVKHNGPALKPGKNATDLPFTIQNLSQTIDFKLDQHATLEAQIVDIADDTAYCNHDVEDGLRGGFFTLDDLRTLTLYRDVIPRLEQNPALCDPELLIAAMIREQMGVMIADILATTRTNLSALNPQTIDDIREAGHQIVRFSDTIFPKIKELREFLFARFYGAPPLRQMAARADIVITGLFRTFTSDPSLIPAVWRAKMTDHTITLDSPRLIADYIAGMTDGYAEHEFARIVEKNN